DPNWTKLTNTDGVVPDYALDSIAVTVNKGDIVKIEDDYTGGGDPGTYYTYTNSTPFTGDLSTINYKTDPNWAQVKTDLSTLKTPTKDDFQDKNRWRQEASISATAVAASVSAAFSGQNSMALSGAGAVSTNTILSKTNAYVLQSTVESHTAIGLDA